MKDKTQDNNNTLAVAKDGLIYLLDFNIPITLEDAKELSKNLQRAIKESCNVATATVQPPQLVRSLFESIDDPKVLTIFVRTDQEYHDISMALKPRKDTNTALIVAIMEYYKDRDSLNIILSHDVMRERGETFFRYTAQFAQQLMAQSGAIFIKIKALYDPQRKELGIFCRQTELDMSLTFLGRLIDQLKANKQVIVSYNDMPGTYVTWPSMLHHKVKTKLGNPDVKMIKLKQGIRFIIPESTKIVVDAAAALV